MQESPCFLADVSLSPEFGRTKSLLTETQDFLKNSIACFRFRFTARDALRFV